MIDAGVLVKIAIIVHSSWTHARGEFGLLKATFDNWRKLCTLMNSFRLEELLGIARVST